MSPPTRSAKRYQYVESTVQGPLPIGYTEALVLESGTELDAAVLDINLGGEMSFPVADALTVRFVPFLFATGYNEQDIPARYARVARLDKPITPGAVAKEIGRKVGTG